MPRGVDIYGRVLRELRDERGWSAGELARRANAVAKAQGDRQFALDKHQICRYETNKKRPSLRSLCYMLAVLEPSFAELCRLLKPTEPLAALLQLTREAKQHAKAEQTEDADAEPAETDASKAKVMSPMDRRQFGIKLPLAVSAHVALPSATDPLRAEIDEVTGAYATSSPQKLLPQARQVLDKILRELGGPMFPGVRRRLLVDASEVATVAGRMALFAAHPGEADAYFTQARKFADESQVDWVRGCALAAAAGSLHAPLMGDGDSRAALGRLQAAVSLVGTDGLAARWVVMEQAEHFGGRKKTTRR
jgi:transcriptional regulator with XRE-family HTH domain